MVYVDDAKNPYRGMIMCHMAADTLKELHYAAKLLGLQSSWFQKENIKFPHYDICQSKRTLAIELGAKPITQREMVIISRTIEKIK